MLGWTAGFLGTECGSLGSGWRKVSLLPEWMVTSGLDPEASQAVMTARCPEFSAPGESGQLLALFPQAVPAHSKSPSNREAKMEKLHRGPQFMSSRSDSEQNNRKRASENKLISPRLFYCSWFYDRVFHSGWKNTNTCPGTKHRKESVLRTISPLDFSAVLTRLSPWVPKGIP